MKHLTKSVKRNENQQNQNVKSETLTKSNQSSRNRRKKMKHLTKSVKTNKNQQNQSVKNEILAKSNQSSRNRRKKMKHLTKSVKISGTKVSKMKHQQNQTQAASTERKKWNTDQISENKQKSGNYDCWRPRGGRRGRGAAGPGGAAGAGGRWAGGPGASCGRAGGRK